MEISKLKKEIDAEIAGLKTELDCNEFHQKYLGKGGAITLLLRDVGKLEADERARVAQELNVLKRDVEGSLFVLQKEFKEREINEKLLQDKLVDISIPDIGREVGFLHPITRVMREVTEAFATMGFIIEDGNEIVTEYENFTSLNVAPNHPARDMQDTFWLDNGGVLRTHTTALQNYLYKKYGPECRVIFPGRCYRNENIDASHDMAFFQVDGIMVGKDVSIANLIYFMKRVLSAVFKKDIKVRLRPGFFPFTEPSFELDASCMFCESGCNVCKKSGWIEFCGCGMIHPNVLEMGGINPNEYQGFAFGFGLTRLVMLKFGVDDVRVFNSGNIEALGAVK
ncbi:MAG: phenylalanine--tRNA ligase subunit alpha [Firmicutes bacterium]|nr:phenylalanine--tRNA ligase subunit alpha [Bacillota bacterium]